MAATYLYDPRGRRVKKSGTGVTTASYLLDGDNEIAEYDGTGALTLRFVPGAAIDDVIAQVTAGGTRTFVLDNHQGSTVAMTSTTGAKTEGITTYDAYGAPSITTGFPYKFTGRRYDPETGLYYYRARYYSSAWGRFLQTDPIGYGDDYDLYTYVGNEPVDRMDALGLWICEVGQNNCDKTRKALEELRKARDKAKKSRKAKIDKILKFYGEDDVDNKVSVHEGDTQSGFTHTENGRTTIRYNPNFLGGSSKALAGALAHEGQHGIDEVERFGGHDPSTGRQLWDTELRASTIESWVNQASGFASRVWNESWSADTIRERISDNAWMSLSKVCPNCSWDPAVREYSSQRWDPQW